MMIHRIFTPADLVRRKAVKAALHGLHEGAHGLPRRTVFEPLGVSEATYSRWLREECPELPDALQIMAIVSLARNAAPLQAMAAHCGDGYQVVPDGPTPAPERLHLWALMMANMEADHAAEQELLRAMEDGTLEPLEAVGLIPKLVASVQGKNKLLEVAQRVMAQRPLGGS